MVSAGQVQAENNNAVFDVSKVRHDQTRRILWDINDDCINIPECSSSLSKLSIFCKGFLLNAHFPHRGTINPRRCGPAQQVFPYSVGLGCHRRMSPGPL